MCLSMYPIMIALLVGFQVTSEASEEPTDDCGVTAMANRGIDGFAKYFAMFVNIKSGRSDILDIELSLFLLLFISGSSLLICKCYVYPF